MASGQATLDLSVRGLGGFLADPAGDAMPVPGTSVLPHPTLPIPHLARLVNGPKSFDVLYRYLDSVPHDGMNQRWLGKSLLSNLWRVREIING